MSGGARLKPPPAARFRTPRWDRTGAAPDAVRTRTATARSAPPAPQSWGCTPPAPGSPPGRGATQAAAPKDEGGCSGGGVGGNSSNATGPGVGGISKGDSNSNVAGGGTSKAAIGGGGVKAATGGGSSSSRRPGLGPGTGGIGAAVGVASNPARPRAPWSGSRSRSLRRVRIERSGSPDPRVRFELLRPHRGPGLTTSLPLTTYKLAASTTPIVGSDLFSFPAPCPGSSASTDHPWRRPSRR